MTEHSSDLSDTDIARALKNRRDYMGLSQRDMGLRLDPPRSGQAYSRFESGSRLKPRDLDAALKALEIGYDDLRAYLDGEAPKAPTPARPLLSVPLYGTPAFVAGSHVLKKATTSNVIDASSLFTGTLKAVQMPDESMAPKVEQGAHVFFDVAVIPTRGALAVIERNGELLVRLYEKQDGSSLFVSSLSPERKTETLPLREISGLYAVRFTGN